MTKINNDPSKVNLIVVKSELNDKNSESYLKKIKKVYNDYYYDEINLIIAKCKDQNDFEKLLSNQRGSVLVLHPSNFVFPHRYMHRNAEKDQVVQVVMNMITIAPPTKKILILGSGKVAVKLETLLNNDNRVVMKVKQRNIEKLENEFMNDFDIIINCTRYDYKLNLFYTGSIFDVAGNFKSSELTEHNVKSGITTIQKANPIIITRGDIGKSVTELMLNEVIDNGL